MSEQHFASGPSCCEPDLDHHLEAFLSGLTQAGYAENTRRGKARRIAPFIQWTHRSGIRLCEVNDLDACIDAFLASPGRRLYKHRSALQAFLAYLREAKVLPPRPMKRSTADALRHSYLEHLQSQQGLSAHSIAAYAVSVRGFIEAMHLPEEAADLDARAIQRYLLTLSPEHAVATVKVYAAGLRSFLRFCLLKGLISRDFSTALPCIGRCQPKPMPPILGDEDIERVLATVDRSSLRGCREFAVLQLLARLGLRASEVLALRLEDLHWEQGEMLVRGKGAQFDRLPLLQDVGDAIVQYLRVARGRSDSRHLFLSRKAPRIALQDPSTISAIAHRALERAGLLPSGRVGAHIFRYSLATRMLRHGASLSEIAEVLRHRCIATTQGYANVDLERLRDVAQAWPGVQEVVQ
ncbi:MAG: integrase [Halochromatium sp.]|nr:integrase [Halochromatium sp.]